MPVFPPQLNTITLQEGIDRTRYWREAVRVIYGEESRHIPHGFYIPIEDIKELAKLTDYYSANHITGVRAYFTFHHKQPDQLPYTDAITAILVPVHLEFREEPHNNLRYAVEKDLIIDVESDNVPASTLDGQHVSIYDVTMPCPKICDPTSPLH